MAISNERPLVVGIDGTEAGLRALDWAAAQAAQRGWPLRLVNVFRPEVPDSPFRDPDDLGDPATTSAAVLAAAVEHLGRRAAELDGATVSRPGSPVTTLLDELADGRMLVIGRRGEGGFAARLLRSTSLACSVRATRPVIVVPAGASAAATTDVVLGVQALGGEDGAIALAFDHAHAMHSRLVVVHAWEDMRYAPEARTLLAYRARAGTAQATRVAEAIALWRAQHPDVEIHVVLVTGNPADALLRHGARADLLVIGGCQPVSGSKLLLGSAARSVIETATCAVAVVHDPPLVQRLTPQGRVRHAPDARSGVPAPAPVG